MEVCVGLGKVGCSEFTVKNESKQRNQEWVFGGFAEDTFSNAGFYAKSQPPRGW